MMELMKMYIQCDWQDSLSVEGSSCWITIERENMKREAKLVRLEDNELTINYLNESEQFPDEMKLRPSFVNRRCVKFDVENQPTVVFDAPVKEFSHLHSGKKIDCLAVTDSLGASASSTRVEENAILMWNVETGEVRRRLVGHSFGINALMFFPSGLVLLSASLDLRVWSCETGSCPRVMKSHVRPIEDIGIVGKGKNVGSVALDGKLNLFSCASGDVIKHVDYEVGVCCMDIAVVTDESVLENLSFLENNVVDAEFETLDKIVVVATKDARLVLHHLASNARLCSIKINIPENEEITTCRFVSACSIASGATNGTIHLTRLDQNFSYSTVSFNLSHGTPISSIETVGNFVYVATKDGSVTGLNLIQLSLEGENEVEKEVKIVRELTGADCDAVYEVCANSKHIFTSCRDGKIRIYNRICRI